MIITAAIRPRLSSIVNTPIAVSKAGDLNKKDKRVIRDILREYGIASFGNKALEKNTKALENLTS